MDLTALGPFIQQFGFPTLACIGIGFFAWKLVNRVLSESAKREDKLYDLLTEYGDKMSEITATLDKLSGKVDMLLKQ